MNSIVCKTWHCWGMNKIYKTFWDMNKCLFFFCFGFFFPAEDLSWQVSAALLYVNYKRLKYWTIIFCTLWMFAQTRAATFSVAKVLNDVRSSCKLWSHIYIVCQVHVSWQCVLFDEPLWCLLSVLVVSCILFVNRPKILAWKRWTDYCIVMIYW